MVEEKKSSSSSSDKAGSGGCGGAKRDRAGDAINAKLTWELTAMNDFECVGRREGMKCGLRGVRF